MLGWLVGVGAIATIIGLILTVLEVGGDVSADTQFGTFSGAVGPVALVLGIVLMAIGGLA
jgi:hypothetical protein